MNCAPYIYQSQSSINARKVDYHITYKSFNVNKLPRVIR